MRICVDYTRCTGHGICETIAPSVFEVGDDEVVHLVDEDPPDDLRPDIQDAIDECPTQALSFGD
ncbi:ferredoxin [Hoyosella subflava]|uniref:Ferredoxin n=1 Tax=Hoyosella subflava (strain DSM 45089 / JCM 17490 / NBRC 109087 / DQS3-9A1) TaxID=443218 RepID=F6EK17_HOYSD|nr:ferredoxin [Hoyosella subflava]AEF41375.1 Ferredoxin reductase [Hoyosella subflava DQS3-9A1]